jgi:hypothetical protein
MAFDINAAIEYVSEAELPAPRIVAQVAKFEEGPALDATKNQGQVVGSGLFSFAQGVDAEVRQAISDSALLAQLIANKRVPGGEPVLKWYGAYFEVLTNIGWTIQASTFEQYKASGNAAETYDQIIKVLAAAIVPATTALAVLMAGINALKSMTPKSSWFTIFKRDSEKGAIARFQTGLVEKGTEADVRVALLASSIEGNNTTTQVLFWKVKHSEAKLKTRSAEVSINRRAMLQLQPKIQEKIGDYQTDYLSSIQDLKV